MARTSYFAGCRRGLLCSATCATVQLCNCAMRGFLLSPSPTTVQLWREQVHQSGGAANAIQAVQQRTDGPSAYIAGLPHIRVTRLSHSARDAANCYAPDPSNESGIGRGGKWMGTWEANAGEGWVLVLLWSLASPP